MIKTKKNCSKFLPKVGEIVLIKDNLPRGQWKIGRINKLIQSRDNVVRSAMVILPSRGSVHRALKLLYPIECPKEDTVEEQSENNWDCCRRNDEEKISRKAAKVARERIGLYFNDNHNEEQVSLGSVPDM